MNITIITRQQLEIINRRTLGYPLQIAEKDYFLAVVMQIISQSDLQNILVFKGGTALHHCYLEQHRFSEDLDFTSNQKSLTLENVRGIFADYDFLNIQKDFQSEFTIKIEKLQYVGPLRQPNSLKMEIDRFQNVLLPPKTIKYTNVWGLDFRVTVMDVREIGAEKIRAMSDRARYRDFSDFFLLVETYQFDLDEITTYVSQKEIRNPITKANIRRNWKVAGTQKEKEMGQVFYSRKVDDAQIENLIERLPFTEITSPKTESK
jgi:predicted nucleotidyltransferase component of viral defense system